MTLKEKLCEPFGGLRSESVNELEKIADDFAIGFAKYVLINNGKYKYIDLEKMLKLFKKEKGL